LVRARVKSTVPPTAGVRVLAVFSRLRSAAGWTTTVSVAVSSVVSSSPPPAMVAVLVRVPEASGATATVTMTGEMAMAPAARVASEVQVTV
jgi:hypothetical protein